MSLLWRLHYRIYWIIKNKYGSIIKGFEENKKAVSISREIKKFVSFKGGLSTIIDRLEEVLTETVVKKGVVTTAVSKQGNRYEVSFANQESIQADYVVLATPHDIAETLLQSNELNEQFHTFKNSSLISIYLGFDILDEQLPADGYRIYRNRKQ